MRGFMHVAVVVVSLLSAGHSAPVTNCETLTQPIEVQGRDQLLGRWTLIAESTTIPGSRYLTMMFVQSAWAKLTAANESDGISSYQSQKMLGRCYTLRSEMSVKNNTLSMSRLVNASIVSLHTGCPDCLVLHSTYGLGEKTHTGLQLLSRRTEVSDAEAKEFMRQVECLGLPAPAVLDSGKGFCPDESENQETESIDLTAIMNEMGSDIFTAFDRIVSSEGGLNMLFKAIASGISGLKDQ